MYSWIKGSAIKERDLYLSFCYYRIKAQVYSLGLTFNLSVH